MESTSLRSLIAVVDGELKQLADHPDGGPVRVEIAELQVSFARLVTGLALGPELLMRQCSTCQRSVMRAALRCGFCWTKLRPDVPNEA